MVDTEVVAGLAVGYFGSQFLGNFIEGKVKPGILKTSTSQDKMIAGIANDGSKVALAYGAYSIARTSPFMKNIAWGSTLAAVIDAGWRYSHNGVPYGYKPFNIPLLGDLNEIIAGPNVNTGHVNQEHLTLLAPPISPAKRQIACNAIKAEVVMKNRQYTAQEMELCAGLLSLQVPAPAPGTSPGDITPPDDIAAPNEDEYPVSTIPNRKSRFSFMGKEKAKHFGFAFGSPTSLREKYFGMKT